VAPARRRQRSESVDRIISHVAPTFGTIRPWTALDLHGTVQLQTGVLNHMHVNGFIRQAKTSDAIPKICHLQSGHICWRLTQKGMNRAIRLGFVSNSKRISIGQEY
jgi:hypothetical protein